MGNNVQLVLFFDLQHFQKHFSFLPLFGSSFNFFSRILRTRHGSKVRMLSDLRINGILTMSIHIRQLEEKSKRNGSTHICGMAWHSVEQFLKKIRQRITKEHKQHHHDEIKDH